LAKKETIKKVKATLNQLLRRFKEALLRVAYWFPDCGPLVFAGDEGSL